MSSTGAGTYHRTVWRDWRTDLRLRVFDVELRMLVNESSNAPSHRPDER
jgi:hypothetical protein